MRSRKRPRNAIRRPFSSAADEPLDPGGDYKWRRDGEYHLFNPENIYYLQQACRTGDYGLFQRFSACINNRSEQIKNLRGLLRIAERDSLFRSTLSSQSSPSSAGSRPGP